MSYGRLLFGYSRSPKLLGSGTFNCPGCREQKYYRLRQNVLYFYFFFIPVFPLRDLDIYVECDGCKKRYEKRVLSFREKEKPLGDFQETAIKLLILFMVCFEKNDDVHIDACRCELGEMTGDDVPFEAVADQIERKMRFREDAINMLSRESDRLNVEEKLQVLCYFRNIALCDKSDLLDHEAEFRQITVAFGFGVDQFDFVMNALLEGV